MMLQQTQPQGFARDDEESLLFSRPALVMPLLMMLQCNEPNTSREVRSHKSRFAFQVEMDGKFKFKNTQILFRRMQTPRSYFVAFNVWVLISGLEKAPTRNESSFAQ